MILLPTGVRVWLATGHTDMRKGFPSLALQVQEILHRDPLSGHLFCFRGRRGNLLKVIWHDGQGACLFTKLGPMDFGIADDGQRAGREQAAQIAISSFADVAKFVLPPARILLRNEPDPGREVPA
jgi:transposase